MKENIDFMFFRNIVCSAIFVTTLPLSLNFFPTLNFLLYILYIVMQSSLPLSNLYFFFIRSISILKLLGCHEFFDVFFFYLLGGLPLSRCFGSIQIDLLLDLLLCCHSYARENHTIKVF